MLAQNFKSSDDLRVPAEDHAALIKILGMMERGEFRHIDPVYNDHRVPAGMSFNMETTGCQNACGTVACIGGWVSILKGEEIPSGGNLHERCQTGALKSLYFPPEHHDYAKISIDQAAAALRNYLTLGHPHWGKVLGGGTHKG